MTILALGCQGQQVCVVGFRLTTTLVSAYQDRGKRLLNQHCTRKTLDMHFALLPSEGQRK